MNLDFNNICRLCLKLTKASVDLFPKNGVRDLSKEEADKIIEKIECCYNIQIQPNDELPTKICHKCIQIVTLFYISKQNTFQSDQFLKNSLLLKRLAERDGSQELEGDDKTISENESNNGSTSGSSVQIIGEASSTSTQELNAKNVIKLQSSEPSGNVELIESQTSSCNDERSSSPKSDTIKKSEAPLSQSNNKKLIKENINNGKVFIISNKSKTSKLSRTVIQRRARKFFKKKNNIIVTTVNEDGDDILSPESDLHAEESKDSKTCKIKERDRDKVNTPDESYPKGGEHGDNPAINIKSDELSHDLNSNALDSSSPNSFALVKNPKIKSELQNGGTKVLVKSSKNKEDKLKDYYEKLLNTDKSLKVKYCRLTSQKHTLKKEMVLEKKKTHDVNMKIYNLVRATVNIASAVAEMANFSDKEKMERVFDRLIRGDGQFENFVKGQQKSEMNEGDADSKNKNDEKLKDSKEEDSVGKPSGSKLPGNFRKKLTTNWNDLQADLTEKEKNPDTAIDKIKLESEAEASKDKPKSQKTVKKRSPEEIKVIGTDIDLHNILSPEVKRKRISYKEQMDDESPTNSPRKKPPATPPTSELKSDTESDDQTQRPKKSEKRISSESSGSKKKLLKITKSKLKQK